MEFASNTYRIFVISCSSIIRRGLEALFKKTYNLELVGESDNFENSIEPMFELKNLAAIIIDFDIEPLKIRSEEFESSLKKIKTQFPKIKFIRLASKRDLAFNTVYTNIDFSGTIDKKKSGERIIELVTTIIDPQFCFHRYNKPKIRTPKLKPLFPKLSKMEKSVLELSKQKLSYCQIAEKLETKTSNVYIFKSRLCQKLKVKTLEQALKVYNIHFSE